MRLLNLPEEVKKIMVKEKLTEGVMRPLVSRDEKTIKRVLPKIIEEGWTARKVERYFQDNKAHRGGCVGSNNSGTRTR
jgi:hypothetical protein